jgi:hypothetical protein
MGGLVLGGHPSMADYYSVIALAVSRLPSKTDEARHGIYERARTALQETLRTLHPPISETEIANEQAVLDAAICTVEVVNDIMTQFGHERAVGPLSQSRALNYAQDRG